MCTETRQRMEAIARQYGSSYAALCKPGRQQWAVDARLECYRYLWCERGWSTPEIGAAFNRDHTTGVYALDNKDSGLKKRKSMARCYAEHAA